MTKIICYFFFIFASSGALEASILPPKCKWELSIAAIFQNEARFLKEWIEFHRLVGVDHFWLYNNGSTDNYYKVLKPYIHLGIVELIDWSDEGQNIVLWNDIQCQAFMDAIKRAKNKSHWVAFIDTDEFLFSVNQNSVAEFLKPYKKYGGVTANWQVFGTSHVEKLSRKDLMIERLVYRNPSQDSWNLHIKSIVNPLTVTTCSNPHFFSYREGFSQVTTSQIPFTGPFSPHVEVNELRINHYWTRDEFFLYQDKIPRYIKWGKTIESVLQFAESFNKEIDFEILRFVPELRRKMQ